MQVDTIRLHKLIEEVAPSSAKNQSFSIARTINLTNNEIVRTYITNAAGSIAKRAKNRIAEGFLTTQSEVFYPKTGNVAMRRERTHAEIRNLQGAINVDDSLIHVMGVTHPSIRKFIANVSEDYKYEEILELIENRSDILEQICQFCWEDIKKRG